MPAVKTNYLVVYEGHSQVYGTASESIALSTEPPFDIPLEKKHILFVTFDPDKNEILVSELPREQVLNAEIKVKEKKVKAK